MPGQAVCLRYGPFVVLEEVVSENKVRVKVLPNYAEKVKGVIHWVSKENSIPAIVNQYAPLLTVENVAEQAKKDGRDWLTYINPQSLVKYENARIWNMQADAKVFDRFQFERVGYFCVDKISKTDAVGGKLVFNGIVTLKEAAAKRGN